MSKSNYQHFLANPHAVDAAKDWASQIIAGDDLATARLIAVTVLENRMTDYCVNPTDETFQDVMSAVSDYMGLAIVPVH